MGSGEPACEPCRSRHLQCDRKRPTCARCLKDKVECTVPDGPESRPKKKARIVNSSKHQPDFPSDQPWMTVKHSLVFVDETDPTLEDEERPVTPEAVFECNSCIDASGSILPEPEEAPDDQCERSSFTNQIVGNNVWDIGNQDALAASNTTNTHGGAAVEAQPQHSQNSPRQFTDTATDSLRSETFILSPDQVLPSHAEASVLVTNKHISNRHTLLERDASSGVLAGSPNAPSTGHVSVITPEAAFLLPTVPFLTAHEAYLMQHFIEHLAPSIDICNQDQVFGRLVPRMAFLSPVLMTSIFAAAAKHISKTGEVADPTAEKYFQECLDHLIPMLNDPEAVIEDYLLAAVVMLRVMEEMDIPLSGYDQQSHLPAIHALISAQERYATTGGLRQAAFWVGFRQEMVVAFVNQRPIVPVLEHCNIDRSFSKADDCTWTNRIIVHCADVINRCFKGSSLNQAAYQALVDYGEAWMVHKPRSFTPVFQSQPSGNGSPFTRTWYASDTVAKGVQHYHLSKILLIAHDPSVPRLGFRRRDVEQSVDEQLRHHARILCGIAQGSGKTAAVWVTTCMGISWCGDRFTSRVEQEELLGILRHTDRKHARHTASTQKQLMQAWDWPERATDL